MRYQAPTQNQRPEPTQAIRHPVEVKVGIELPKTLPPITEDPPCAGDLPIGEAIPPRPESSQAGKEKGQGRFLKIPIGAPPPCWLKPVNHEANDDIRLPHFVGLPDIFAGKQRKGADNLVQAEPDPMSHLRAALKMPFPLSKQTPLPREITESIIFIQNSTLAQAREKWNQQLSDLRRRASELAQTKQDWDSNVPQTLGQAAGKLHVPLVVDILKEMNAGCHAWFSQFISGFPLVGTLSQNQAYPRDSEMSQKKCPTEAQVAKAAWGRFNKRQQKHGFGTGSVLWDEAMDQIQKGWLSEPRQFEKAEYDQECIPPAFRFGVHQADKIRACDDLKDNGANALCIVQTPITVPSWDHVVSMCELVRKSPGTWSFGKVDHESAYKFLPINPDHMRMSRIILRHPQSGILQIFQAKVLPFGSVAAVLHYNIFARCIAFIINEIFRIPILNYFDDFGFLTPSGMAGEAMRVVSEFCQILNIRLKLPKSEFGPDLNFLGLRGIFPSIKNGMNLQVMLPEEKAEKWALIIKNIIEQRTVSATELESLIGKLGFSQTQLFGKFSRAMFRDLYRKLNRKSHTPQISTGEQETLKWWLLYIRLIQPRIARPPAQNPQVIVYTDARGEPPRIAAVFIDTREYQESHSYQLLLTADITPETCQKFSGTSLIYALEAIAAIAAVVQNQEILSGRAVLLFVDNTAALNAIIKSSSPDNITAALIRLFWSVVATRSIDIWIEWAPSAQNLADPPSRDKNMPISGGRTEPFMDVNHLISQALEPDSIWPFPPTPLHPFGNHHTEAFRRS